ncbi:MAG: hypothetical protein LBD78_01850 [Spirochaetaceae bacterium]|jgi:hypothetical protein|nr:hypothetical protein [Spirochaetaceae bacterium]
MSGKGGSNRRRNFQRRTREQHNWVEEPPVSRRSAPDKERINAPDLSERKKKGEKLRFDKTQGIVYERPKWTPIKLPTEPLPSPDCPICGKPIKDISSAITEKNSGEPAHFDCIIAKIAEQETLEPGDRITYIGGGRFGVVHFNSPQDVRNFKIKKIFEWEDKENRAGWRSNIADHFSVT